MSGKVTRGARGSRSASRGALVAAYRAAIAAVDPRTVAANALALDRRRDRLVVRGRGRRVVLPLGDGLVVIGAGKGAAGLAAGVEEVVGARVVGGCVIVPPGYERPLARVAIVHGSHPVPDATSVAATRRALAALERHPRAAVLVVLTGGASSLFVLPAAGLSLADVRRAGAWLLASGIDIAGANAIRKHLSGITGGRLAARLVGRAAAAIVVSDVPGDDLAVIGSGPTVADPTTFRGAFALVRGAASAPALPAAVRRHLARGVRGAIAETPKPGSSASRACPTLLLAGNATARGYAAAWGRRAGFPRVVVRRAPLVGTTDEAARAVARSLRAAAAHARAGASVLWIAGGETTVRLGVAPGKGGRNQALALAVARALAGVGGWTLLAAGTDGIDGPTDAAGGFADGSSARRARRLGRSLERALDRHDAYPLLAALGDLFRPGPTGTNVADLVIAIVRQDRGWRPGARVIQATRRR
ncbi:MAG: DUF4147 domain-containing protein [Deltaproteobacteria bacterium]|nr:DUF4147 domain-containing protein [Deltaproteobacteria bacterium]